MNNMMQHSEAVKFAVIAAMAAMTKGIALKDAVEAQVVNLSNFKCVQDALRTEITKRIICLN